MLLFAILAGLLALALFQAYQTRQRVLRYTRKFGCPEPHWLFGHLLNFPKDPVGITMHTIEIQKQYGPDTVLWRLGNDHQLIIGTAKNAEKVLMPKDTAKANVYGFVEPWLGNGLLISSGEKWFQRRKIITPTFHFKILESFVEVFNKETDVLVNNLRTHVGKGEFDIYDPISLYALDSICSTSMGVHINALAEPTNQYVSDVKAMSELVLMRIFHPLNPYPKLFWLTTPNAREQRKLIARLHQFTDSVIKKRRQEMANQPKEPEPTDPSTDLYSKKRQTFLDLLLNVTVNGRPLSDSDIREEVDTFMFEGHDTTTSGISFTIYQLAKHQDIQEKVYQEILSLLGAEDSKTAPLNQNILQNFKYLEMVLKEAMRIMPPVAFIGRKIQADTEMNGVIVPAGTDITVSIRQIHRNPAVYPKPDRFDPERFSEHAEHKRGPFDYIPFSVGSRNCIGQRYAIMEMKITLIRLLANYKILAGESLNDLRFKMDLVLRPVDGIPIRVQARK
uniref:Cytochrome P450 n=1 Tax=Culex quinquefasciatus TaxID=7176 RepID=H9BE28_CULQU|nr:cytochrome P450 [Culex quinquefasciatus]